VASQTTGQARRLVIVASREPLTDLEGMPAYRPMPVDKLTKIEGELLLRQLGVKGTEENLQSASEDFGGHALTLVLWGSLIAKNPVNNITQHHELTLFENDRSKESEESEYWKHAIKLLNYYEQHRAIKLLDYYKHHVAQQDEIILLQMMSLFHRAMSQAERDHLLRCANFAKGVAGKSDEEWEVCHGQLESLGLLNSRGETTRKHWDCHPLIREHFRDKFRQDAPEHWRQAHRVLFDYFASLPTNELPKTREELIPLYRAVHHGCLAHAYHEALELYRSRIIQGDDKSYGANELGAISEDTSALRMFYIPETTELLDDVRNSLRIDDQAWLQARTAFCMAQLGTSKKP